MVRACSPGRVQAQVQSLLRIGSLACPCTWTSCLRLCATVPVAIVLQCASVCCQPMFFCIRSCRPSGSRAGSTSFHGLRAAVLTLAPTAVWPHSFPKQLWCVPQASAAHGCLVGVVRVVCRPRPSQNLLCCPICQCNFTSLTYLHSSLVQYCSRLVH